MHILAKEPFVYYNDWSLIAVSGDTITRTDNNLIFTEFTQTPIYIVENGEILINDFLIENVFLIQTIVGSFNNTNLFYRSFDIKDLDQRIGLVSSLTTVDKSSIVGAINSLKVYVDAFLQSSEVEGSPYGSYADFLADAGATIQQSKYAYVSFPTLSGLPVGGNWDRIQVNDTWRLDCGDESWQPTSNMTASATATLEDISASSV